MPSPHSSSPLLESYEHQDQVFAQAFSTLQEAIAQKAFPAASVAVTHHGRLVAMKAMGTLIYDEIKSGAPSFSRSSREDGDFAGRRSKSNVAAPVLASFARTGISAVNPSTLFDVASLTKVVATTPMAMLLYERGLLDLDAPVSAIVPEFIQDAAKDPRRQEVTVRMLLCHSSGLPAYEKLYLKASARAELLHAAFTTPLSPRRAR